MEIIDKFSNKEFLPGLIYLFLLILSFFIKPFIKKFCIDFTLKRVWSSILLAFLIASIPIILKIVIPQFSFPIWSIILIFSMSVLITISIFIPFPHEFLILYLNELIMRRKATHSSSGSQKLFNFFVFSSSARIRYYRGILNYNRNRDDLDKAYEALGEMHKISLFPFEQVVDIHSQILLFLELGNFRKAELLWKNAPQEYKINNESQIPLALFYRSKADFDSEYQVLFNVTQVIKPNTFLSAQVYNNLAVNAISRGNDSDRLLYYQKAKKAMYSSNAMILKHTILPNLIDTYLLLNKPDEAGLEFKEYQNLIDQQNRHDQISFYNYILTYYRQKDDLLAIEETLNYGNKVLYPTFSHEEKLNLKICELRIRWNNGLSGEKFLIQVITDIEEYLSLPFPASFMGAKEIYHGLKGFSQINPEHPILPKAMLLLQEFARFISPLLDKKLIDLQNDLTSIRREILKDKLFLIRLKYRGQCDQDFIELIYSIINGLNDILDVDQRSGSLVEEIDSHLNISEEIIHQLNDPFTSGFYSRSGFFEIRDRLLKIASDHNQFALEKLSLFKYDITVMDKKLRLAWYFLKMEDFNESRKLFENFRLANLSINHYADWIRNYYMELNHAFPK